MYIPLEYAHVKKLEDRVVQAIAALVVTTNQIKVQCYSNHLLLLAYQHMYTQTCTHTHAPTFFIMLIIYTYLNIDGCTDDKPPAGNLEPTHNSSDEQSTGEVDEENIETEIVTFDNDLLSLVNSLFS